MPCLQGINIASILILIVIASIIRPYKVFRLRWHRELWWLIAWKGLDFQVKTPKVVTESAKISAGKQEPEKSSLLPSLPGLQCKEKHGGGLQHPLELSPLGL